MPLPKSTYITADNIDAAWLNEIATLAAGLQTIAVAATDVTLSAAQYQARIIKATGVLTAAVSLIVPLDSGRVWLVVNSTTGAFALTVKGATGTGIVVATAKAALVFCDGVNVLRATADV